MIGVYDPASLGGYRGAFELPNGNILTTNGDGVHEIGRSGNLVETKLSGVSARFIEPIQLGSAVPESLPVPLLSPAALLLLALLLAGLASMSAGKRAGLR